MLEFTSKKRCAFALSILACLPALASSQFSENTYLISWSDKIPYTKLSKYCANQDAVPVTITSAAENEFVRQLALASPRRKLKDGDQFWIGLTDAKLEGQFIWTANQQLLTPTSYNNWGKTTSGSQPNNVIKNGEDEDCVVLRNSKDNKDGPWYDIGCTKRIAFPICEKQ